MANFDLRSAVAEVQEIELQMMNSENKEIYNTL
jgi:hypothetical protein